MIKVALTAFGGFRRILFARWFDRLSLRSRLGLIFLVIVIVSICLTLLSLWTINRITMRGVNLAVTEQWQLENVTVLRENIATLGRLPVHSPERNLLEVQIRSLFANLRRADGHSAEQAEIISRAAKAFEDMAATLKRAGSTEQLAVRRRTEDALASVGALMEMKQIGNYRSVHLLRWEQEQAVHVVIVLIALFVLGVGIVSWRIMALVTRPLSDLSRMLDEADLDSSRSSDLALPKTGGPEISSVARNFEQLLTRLRQFQEINVRRLVAEKRRADVVAESITDGIVLLQGKRVVYVNSVAARILGPAPAANRARWKGIDLEQLQSTGGRGVSAVLASLARTMPSDYRLESEDGRKLFYMIQSYPIVGDVIERVDHSLRDAGAHLLEPWEADTVVLARDVTLVRESQEAKGHFVATLSHEVKTPVTSLTMATRLLRKAIDQFPNATHRSLIETCAEDVERLRVLIENLLSVSHFDTLTQKMNLQSVDLGKLLRQSIQFFQPQSSEKGVALVLQPLPGKKVVLTIDAAKVSWAVSNLLMNALRHTPRGGRIDVRIEQVDGGALIRIKDSGPGIERDRQEKLFSRFSSFYDLRVGRSGSVGMGLAIAREIVAAHGGKISVSSEPGLGAEFLILFPASLVMEGERLDSRTGSR